MTARTNDYSVKWILVGAALFLIFYMISYPIGQALGHATYEASKQFRFRQHAVERHGPRVHELREAALNGGPGNHWRCKDGKEIFATRLESGEWAITIFDKNGVELTTFPTTQEYLVRTLERDGCENGWHYDHP